MKKVVRAVSLMLLMAGVCGNAFAEEMKHCPARHYSRTCDRQWKTNSTGCFHLY